MTYIITNFEMIKFKNSTAFNDTQSIIYSLLIYENLEWNSLPIYVSQYHSTVLGTNEN